LRIELRRKTPYVVPRDVNFLALETHSQTKIVKPLDHLSSLSRSEIHNLENRYDWASPEIHRIPHRTVGHRIGCSPPLLYFIGMTASAALIKSSSPREVQYSASALRCLSVLL
jgi:hypothetical protein